MQTTNTAAAAVGFSVTNVLTRLTEHWPLVLHSDRWGDLQPHSPLPDLPQRLLEQMFDECTFIATLDGQFGILYEAEFESTQDGDEGHARAVEDVIGSFQAVAAKHLGIRFGVPAREALASGAAAIWAFVPDSTLGSREEIEAFGHVILDPYQAH